MKNTYERGGYLYICKTVRGVPHRESVGKLTDPGVKNRAKVRLLQIEQEIRDGKFGIEKPEKAVLFKEVAKKFVEKKPVWASCMEAWMEYLGNITYHDVSFKKVLAYRTWRLEHPRGYAKKISESSVNRDLTGLSAMYEWVKHMSIIGEMPKIKMPPENPVTHVRKESWYNEQQNRRNRILSDTDIIEFHKLATERVRRAFWAALNTGLRKGDVFRLEPGKFVEHLNAVVGLHSKTNTTFEMPQNENLASVLEQGEIDNTNFRREWTSTMDAFVKLGHEKFVFKDIRRSVGWRIWKRTKDLIKVQHFLGHKDAKTTQIYLGLTYRDLQEVAQHLQEDLPKMPPVQLELVG